MYLKDFEDDIHGRKIHFERNNKLKPINCNLPWSNQYVEEYLKCKNSYTYFIQKYGWILTEEGMKVVQLRDYQEKILHDFHQHRYNCLLAPRQCGKTTSIQLYLLWYILFSEYKKCAILANKGRVARKILKDIKRSYEYVPHFLQQGIKIWNAGYIELENGCSIIADTTSKSGLSSESINILYIDEVALINQNIFWDFYDSNFPTLSSFKESKIFLSSTSKGLNHWYKIWTEAEQGKNGYNPIRVFWQQVPGRDEVWKRNEIAKTSELSFAQEQECSFLGSALTLINGYTLSNLVFKSPLDFPENFILNEKFKKYVKLYDLPQKDHLYTIGVDSSEMQEDSTSDSISLQILDVSVFPFNQVGSLLIRDGINYLETVEPIVQLATYYNMAFIFPELNSTGLEIANHIVDDYDYPNVYYEKTLPGFKTTKKTKKLGCSNIKLLIENGNLILNDFDTISQFGTFIQKGTTYKADTGYKDDAILSLLAAIFFMQDKEFQEENIGKFNYINVPDKEEIEMQQEQSVAPIIAPSHEEDNFIIEHEQFISDWGWLFNK